MSKKIKQQAVTLVRVYTDDSNGHISSMLEQLHQRCDVIGTTIFRGIAGFGDQGHIHQNSLLDLSGHLPIVIEFYHKSEKSEELIDFVHQKISNAHIISWEVNLSFEHLA
ncbi:DUF190 domain-containing protein [sulfur-oxidizing endosymbiont of Gigantopelta aegis]|uniref:DUF190 domain-containing protein n=1 Tax=sulfur-oxidizing endosymbiont of Gigantopelta aegis TaxID=2794934 RepID=UPI0018DE7FEC|nr:DUF190 domain-containing protein [sulfur-oxidizing endosymbiont of Gigantopelta aegis]